MKYLILLFTLLTFNTLASHEVGVNLNRINHSLDYEVPYKFKMDALELTYEYFHDTPFNNLEAGAHLAVRRSTETASIYYQENYRLSLKLDAGYQFKTGLRYKVNEKLKVSALVGLCEWHSTAKVNDIEPSWSKGTNSHKPCYSIHAYYEVEPDWFFRIGAGVDYKKDKVNFGHKQTNSLTFGLVYKF